MNTITPQGWEKWFPRVRALTFLVIGMGIIVFETAHGGRLEVMVVGAGIAGAELPFAYAASKKQSGDS